MTVKNFENDFTGASNEKFYAFNSFVEFGQAFALNVTDISKYKGFVDENIIE